MTSEILDKLSDKLFKDLYLNNPDLTHRQIYAPSKVFEILLKKQIEKRKSTIISIKSNINFPLIIIKNIVDNIFYIDYKVRRNDVFEFLKKEQYEKVDRAVDPGTFHIKGDAIVIVSFANSKCYRIEFFEEVIEKLREIDNVSLRSIGDMDNIAIFPKVTFEKNEVIEFEILKFRKSFANVFILEIKSEKTIDKEVIDLNLATIPTYFAQPIIFEKDIANWKNNHYQIYYIGNEIVKFQNQYQYLEAIVVEHEADRGFISDINKIVVLTDRELFGNLELSSFVRAKNKINKLFEDKVKPGEYIVHEFHGVGIYQGIETKTIDNKLKDYIKLSYLEQDVLFVPIEQTQRITKYIGNGEVEPKLTRLGSAEWETIKKRITKSIEDLADELLDLYSIREMSKGYLYSKDNEMMNNLESSFPYTETRDQLRAIMEIKEDLESEKPMDRLLVGDVGFGKTEIAVRTAFKAVIDHKQVAILAPTTILAAQLFTVFLDRLKEFPIMIERVTRFDGVGKNKAVIEKLKEGKIDIIIGTHRLLSSDVSFKDLGLLIIDEEQRFGVKQKEKIKKYKVNVDVLSMSATPIPRTLQMSLAGIREISILSTPPDGRMGIKTNIIHKNEIYQHIDDEIQRGGQVFFVHNDIDTMGTIKSQIEEMVPASKVIIGHGKMKGNTLEKAMYEFVTAEYNVLLATTIVENGIDLPNVNTIIIDDAHKFGLSQLHQLRGRVGRGKVQAYCYLAVPYFKVSKDIEEALEADHDKAQKKLSQDSIDRVKTLVANQDLGAGFRIASKDMEMRGSGNILGSQQSGNINAVGYELYMRLLSEQIEVKRRKVIN